MNRSSLVFHHHDRIGAQRHRIWRKEHVQCRRRLDDGTPKVTADFDVALQHFAVVFLAGHVVYRGFDRGVCLVFISAQPRPLGAIDDAHDQLQVVRTGNGHPALGVVVVVVVNQQRYPQEVPHRETNFSWGWGPPPSNHRIKGAYTLPAATPAAREVARGEAAVFVEDSEEEEEEEEG